jgi:hypothetical protein
VVEVVPVDISVLVVELVSVVASASCSFEGSAVLVKASKATEDAMQAAINN